MKTIPPDNYLKPYLIAALEAAEPMLYDLESDPMRKPTSPRRIRISLPLYVPNSMRTGRRSLPRNKANRQSPHCPSFAHTTLIPISYDATAYSDPSRSDGIIRDRGKVAIGTSFRGSQRKIEGNHLKERSVRPRSCCLLIGEVFGSSRNIGANPICCSWGSFAISSSYWFRVLEEEIAAVEEGLENMHQTAARFAVHYKAVPKLKYQWRDLGTLEP